MSIIGSLPYTFQNGTTADATQVNANFDLVVSDVNANAAASGVNNDITQLTGLTTALSVAQGGTGVQALTAHYLVIGNGTNGVTLLAPGTTGLPVVSQGGSADPHYAVLGAAGGGTGNTAGTAVPSGSAGGDLTGNYPNPTLVAVGPGAGAKTPVSSITLDAEGRVTAVGTTSALGSLNTLNPYTVGSAHSAAHGLGAIPTLLATRLAVPAVRVS